MRKMNLLFSGILLLTSFQLFSQNPKKSPINLNTPKSIKGYELVWNDEFNIDGKPDVASWKFETGFKRNYELQWYQAENANCKDGILTITAVREKINNPNYNPDSKDWRRNRAFGEYTSASINTGGLKSWKYGRFEIRAKIDSTKGSWPAIWTLGNKERWPANGEIDIMEFYIKNNKQSILANAAHLGKNRGPNWNSKVIDIAYFLEKDPKWLEKFHIWRMDWDAAAIELYLDDELLNEISTANTLNPDGFNPFQQEHYILLNLAIGGENGGDPALSKFPITYEVDYVRVYQENK